MGRKIQVLILHQGRDGGDTDQRGANIQKCSDHWVLYKINNEKDQNILQVL